MILGFLFTGMVFVWVLKVDADNERLKKRVYALERWVDDGK